MDMWNWQLSLAKQGLLVLFVEIWVLRGEYLLNFLCFKCVKIFILIASPTLMNFINKVVCSVI